MEKKKHKLFTRRNFIGTCFLGAASAYSYAHWLEPYRLSITRKEINLPHLPPALDGTVIAHLTDFHFQPNEHEELMLKVVQATNAENPDIIALTGDYITADQKVFPPLMEAISELQAKHGIYGVMGNHDGWHGHVHQFQSLFKKTGFEFLLNQGTGIEINGERIHLLGTDSIWSGHINTKSCYQGHTNEPVIALVHEPDVFDILRANHRVDLQLSGHTHGGQCRVPFIGYAPAKVRYGKNYIQGEYQASDSRIFVSRGLGTVGLRVRFACAPEVAILTLKSGLA